MSNVDFSTESTIETLANEVACLKATLTFMLKAMGQADAGKVIINMENLRLSSKMPLSQSLSSTLFARLNTLTVNNLLRFGLHPAVSQILYCFVPE